MKTPVRILLIEDSPHDALLIERELTAAKVACNVKQIHSERELLKELESRPDLILSDHGLPSFSGFAALEIVRERFPQLPFIFVSGSNDQAMIVDMYDRGATDYVFKGDIHDLDEAVGRALEPELAETVATPVTADLEQPAVRPANVVVERTPGHLLFCPSCQRTWDDKGILVPLDRYLGNHFESVVISHFCEECEWRKREC